MPLYNWKKHNYVVIFLLAYLILGLFLFKQYGVSVDEPEHRIMGLVNLNAALHLLSNHIQITSLIPPGVILPKIEDLNQPAVFDLIKVFLERLFSINDEREVYLFHHLLGFLVFLFAGVLFVYKLATRRFDDWRIGLLAATFLVLSPRFFAESFYNPKDIIFMSFFAMATYTAISFILKPTWKNAIWHSLATAIAIDVRIMAIVIPAMTILMLGLRIARGEIPWRKTLVLAILYIVLAALVVIICWPWLWADPWRRFIEFFAHFSSFPWLGKNLYFSREISGNHVPWHYIPVWIAITTPLLYLALFFLGIGATLKSLVLRHWRLWQGEQELQDLIFLGLFIVPILAVIVLRSTLYDGWRHLYFIYPAFLLIAIKGFVLLRNNSYTQPLLQQWAKPALTTILCISFAWTTVWMVRAHPLQNVYFNALAGKNWKSKFDVDYWGLSNRMALEYILKRDDQHIIKVMTGSFPTLNFAELILKDKYKKRILEVDLLSDATYIINHYRNNLTEYAAIPGSDFERFYDIKVGDELISSIYRRKNASYADFNFGLNHRFDFSNVGVGKNFLLGVGAQQTAGTGWSYPEPWGVWSDGDKAKLFLPLPPDKANMLNLELIGYVRQNHPSQMIEIYLDGKYAKTLEITNKILHHIELPVPANPQKNYIRVEFRLLNPMRPKEIGDGEDNRLLGVGLVGASFR